MKQNADSGISIADKKIWNDPVEEAITFNHSFVLFFFCKKISNILLTSLLQRTKKPPKILNK